MIIFNCAFIRTVNHTNAMQQQLQLTRSQSNERELVEENEFPDPLNGTFIELNGRKALMCNLFCLSTIRTHIIMYTGDRNRRNTALFSWAHFKIDLSFKSFDTTSINCWRDQKITQISKRKEQILMHTKR